MSQKKVCDSREQDSTSELSRGGERMSSGNPVDAKQPLVRVLVAISGSQDVRFTREPACSFSRTLNLCV